MNKLLSSAAVGLAIVGIVLGVVSYQKQPTVLRGIDGTPGQQGPVGPRGPQGEQGPMGLRGPAGQDAVRLGAVSSPDIYSPYLNHNGVYRFAYSLPLQTATTTVCAIQSPAASSTLTLASISETTSTTTASIIDIAKATTAFATTTKIVPTQSLGANAVWSFALTATSSVGTNLQPLSFSPNEWLVIKQVGGAGLSVSPVGKCQAEFVAI